MRKLSIRWPASSAVMVRISTALFGTCRRTGSAEGLFILSIFVEQASKVLITLTLTACRDNVSKPCQALNHFVGDGLNSWTYAGRPIDTGFGGFPSRWGAAY